MVAVSGSSPSFLNVTSQGGDGDDLYRRVRCPKLLPPTILVPELPGARDACAILTRCPVFFKWTYT
ncbi:hypothetical protein E2C01_020321 [Portunus trituberculatus]|uniref:Uncharacterized protein n=1 Tax=Portunus trituberculatus TaxID=210409 RepID=A0A5B7E1E4_PORTR|nr:hypothetical protein [Portunus trituberculatus]